jgi:hypothetical protein
MMQCSFKVKNDPSILEAKNLIIAEGLMPYRYVLRHVPESPYHPYVTHRENMKLEGDTWEHMEFYWGHYFTTIEEARADFEERK